MFGVCLRAAYRGWCPMVGWIAYGDAAYFLPPKVQARGIEDSLHTYTHTHTHTHIVLSFSLSLSLLSLTW